MRELTGKLALVTGGARGVGKAIAVELASRGAHVLINYFHSHESAKQTKAELEAIGAKVDLFRASIARKDQTTRLFDEIRERFGHLDVLVNNAADGALVPVGDVTDEMLDRALDTNLKGGLRCARLAAPLMAGHGGSIVTVSALGGSQLVMANYLACAPAKAAAEAAMRYLAVEFAPLGIRVNTASAAMLVSDVADQFPDAAAMRRVIAESTPSGRLGTPEEFARVVAFLASDDSSWITGQVVLADGGLSLGAATLAPRRVEHAGDRPEPEPDDTIAVVGMGMVVADANGPDEFWRLRLDGAELFAPIPEDRWERANFHSPDHAREDKGYQDKGVFITGFTPVAGAEVPSEHVDDDLTTAWLRHSLVQALDGVTTRHDDRFSFLVGYTADGSQHLEEAGVLAAATGLSAEVLADLPLADAERAALLDGVTEALRARYRRGAEEPSRFLPHRVGALAMRDLLPAGTEVTMVDTACSSSLYAIDIGVKGLLMGRQDVAVCGGAFALAPRGTVLFAKLHGLSGRGDVRALDADADGVMFADGAAVVVLKKLSRARADGDRVLAVIDAVGTSSDGRGKAVYAPNADGQDLAVRRALADRANGGEGVGWVIAHATGTPAGDLAEFTTLRKHFGTAGPTAVTSNKSLIGHTGWAAGVVSVIEAVLGLRHETIPPQHRFTAAPEEFRMGETGLVVPTDPVAWPRTGVVPRTAAVSGFGFGGTNAHVLVREDVPGLPPRPPVRTDRSVVVVGWSGRLPGLSTSDQIVRWLHGGPGPAASFGEFYPMPPFAEVRLPASTVRTVDRCQLMALHCARGLREQLGDLWDKGAERAGVVVGNLGPTRSAMLYATRCYLDDIAAGLAADPALDLPPGFAGALAARVRGLVPPSNEDSFPGMMPNVISARTANYFDLNGPNITLDSGLSSALSAVDVAHRYLVAGELDYALVGGFNGNVLPEYRALLGDLVGADDELAEGAFLFALTTEETAAAHGLPVLAKVGAVTAGRVVDVAADARYAGASGAVALARALTGPAGPVSVVCGGVRVDLTVARKAARVLPPEYTDPSVPPPEVHRYVPELRPSPARDVRPRLPFFPPGTVVVTDDPDLLAAVDVPADTVVLSTRPLREPRAGWHELAERTPLAVRSLLSGSSARHVRLVADLGAVPPSAAVHAGDDRHTALHEAAFLVVQERYDVLGAGGGSFLSLLLGARPDGRDHPSCGLFAALAKCVHHELPECLVFGLFTADADLATAVRRTERESAAERLYPVVVLGADDTDGVVRRTPVLVPEPVELARPADALLSEDSVVLATGGARGITAEVVKELARTFRPRLYLLGSNPLDRYGPEVFEGSDEEFAAGRSHFIRAELAARRGALVAEITREFDRMVDARAAHRNIAEMAEHCGADRVTYLTCDVTDTAAVRAAVARVLAAHDRVDLVISAAGRNRSALIPDKDVAEFRAIRDVKVEGYRNLKSALRDRPPLLWCNFGSLLGHFGLAGELDYGSGNDFLASAADHAATQPGTDEFTVGWTLWDGVGIGADALSRSYFQRGGRYTHMAVGEGVRHFVRELHAANRHPFVLHMGDAELESGRRLYPGYLEAAESGRRTEVVREFDPESVPDVEHHLVRGTPTVPASWITALAAETAATLVPGQEVIGFTDLRFEHFVQAHPAGPKRISARLLEQGDGVTSVLVRITADVVSPGGVRLVADRLLSSVVVRFAREFPPAPHWEAWPEDDVVALPDPYHLDSSPVLLTGPFVATTDTRGHPQGKRARFVPAGVRPSAFTVPAVLIDAMVRTGALALVDGRLPVAVPVSIRRIDLYQRADDHDLVVRHGDLELYATPAASTVGRPELDNRFVATTADGRVVVQVHDVEAIALGYVDPSTAAVAQA